MSSTPLPKVAAVVVNYNGLEVTLDAVASLRRMDYPRFDLVVLDNASSDDSVEELARAHPDLQQIRLTENHGSSAGYAAAFRWAFERDYDCVLLLNNDIEVESDLLTEMVRTLQSDPRNGCAGPKCYFHGGGKRLWSAGGVLRFRESITTERGYGEIDHGQYDEPAVVDYINGCAILITRQAAERAGGWDPLYFICVDDADFCTRIKAQGLRCVYAPRAVLHHRVAWTTGGYSTPRNFQFGRSSAIYARRYGTHWQQLRFVAFSWAAVVVGYARELRRGNQAAALAKWKGLRAGWRLRLPRAPRIDELPRAADYIPVVDDPGGRNTSPAPSSGGLGS